MAVQASAEGRVVRYFTIHGVCFLRADNGVCFFIVIVKVTDLDNAAESNSALGCACIDLFNDLCIFKQNFYLGYLGVELALLGFCLIIFAVLGQIAEAACLFDLLGNFLCLVGLEVLKLLFKSVITFLTHFKSAVGSHNAVSFIINCLIFILSPVSRVHLSPFQAVYPSFHRPAPRLYRGSRHPLRRGRLCWE